MTPARHGPSTGGVPPWGPRRYAADRDREVGRLRSAAALPPGGNAASPLAPISSGSPIRRRAPAQQRPSPPSGRQPPTVARRLTTPRPRPQQQLLTESSRGQTPDHSVCFRALGGARPPGRPQADGSPAVVPAATDGFILDAWPGAQPARPPAQPPPPRRPARRGFPPLPSPGVSRPRPQQHGPGWPPLGTRGLPGFRPLAGAEEPRGHSWNCLSQLTLLPSQSQQGANLAAQSSRHRTRRDQLGASRPPERCLPQRGPRLPAPVCRLLARNAQASAATGKPRLRQAGGTGPSATARRRRAISTIAVPSHPGASLARHQEEAGRAQAAVPANREEQVGVKAIQNPGSESLQALPSGPTTISIRCAATNNNRRNAETKT
jgi:hypothetical protein